MLQQQPGDPGVDGAVADDEDVQQTLPDAAPVLQVTRVTCHESRVTCHLHLPARGVILPHVQRVVPSLGALVNVDLVLHVVAVLPPAVPRYY